MREVKGDWRDLLSVYTLALDCKKIYLGFLAVLVTLAVMTITCVFYYVAGGPDEGVRSLGAYNSLSFLPMWIFVGKGVDMLRQFSPLLNPFHANYTHFACSVLFYILGLYCVARYAGPITRLAALEYARDDIPSLGEARALFNKKWRAYFFSPLSPLLVAVFSVLAIVIAGLVGRIPYVGGWLLLLGYPAVFPLVIMVVLIVLFGVLSYGLMYPAISVDGRDAFDGWSRAYSYVLWGLNRFIAYTALAGAIGVIAVTVACLLGEATIFTTVRTVRLGMGKHLQWVEYYATEYRDVDGLMQRIGVVPTERISERQMIRRLTAATRAEEEGEEIEDGLLSVSYDADPLNERGMRRRYRVLKVGGAAPVIPGRVMLPDRHGMPRNGTIFGGWVAYIFLLGIRGAVAGFAVAYFFSAFTVIYFLLRKHVDRVDVTDIYLEEEEEEPAPLAAESEAEEARAEAEEEAPAPKPAAKKKRSTKKRTTKKKTTKKKSTRSGSKKKGASKKRGSAKKKGGSSGTGA